MSFASWDFAIFFIIVFMAYHLVVSTRLQNILLLASSCFFYGWWSRSYLILMLVLSLTGYLAGRLMGGPSRVRNRAVLLCALSMVLGCLAYFKYASFICDIGAAVAQGLGFPFDGARFSVLLPIAISFHTFQIIAYLVDVYRRRQDPESDLVDFMAFSFFFPQLIAGPIERAGNLLTQFKQLRSVDQDAIEKGLLLLTYGYFLKTALADRAGAIVDSVFLAGQISGWSFFFGTILFGLQIYLDFQGYSLIAKGAAALLGFDLVWNFNLPYWAVSPQDFWRRWHISLSRWLRDYLYVPLGGNRVSALATLRNLFITMALGGLWHGASWNFLLWGVWHGLVLVAHRWATKGRAPQTILAKTCGWFYTMACVFIGWFFFRVTSMEIWRAAMDSLGHWEWMPVHAEQLTAVLSIGAVLSVCEYYQYREGDLLAWVHRGGKLAGGFLMGVFAFLALASAKKIQYAFIYFAF